MCLASGVLCVVVQLIMGVVVVVLMMCMMMCDVQCVRCMRWHVDLIVDMLQYVTECVIAGGAGC